MCVWQHPAALPLLKAGCEAGESYSLIAASIQKATRLIVSRNACVGKAHRLGWAAGKVTARRDKAPPPKRQQKNVAPILPKFGVDFKERPASAAERASCAKDGKALVRWVESGCGVRSPAPRSFIEAEGCKWPLAGGLVCCNPVSRRFYCEGHAKIAYSSAPDVSRQADKWASHDRIDKYRTPVSVERTFWDDGRLAA